MTPGKGGDDKDNPLHFSGEVKDWPTFKEVIQSRADTRDTSWLLEAGRALVLFFARQTKDKTGSGATRKKALERENVKNDSIHVPTSVEPHQVGVQRHTKLGFKDASALAKSYKTVDLKYLRQTNRMAVRLFHDAVFEHPTKETVARTKQHSIL
jgi:hypothetical protein